mmetsp:Transcript_12187/g.17749  ORF Transcript_12187/g.17749 Transcript_12187/m.17749 type:complete len:481 (+) Transcript_12187:1-1443(+)
MGKCFSKSGKNKEVHLSIIRDNIHKHYEMEKLLGKGSFGQVRKAHMVRDPKRKFAVKTIDKGSLKTEKEKKTLKQEIETLLEVDHPNIIKLYESYEDKKYIHLVTEYCSGGELFDHILEKKRYSEKDAAVVMQSILRAVNHLHKNGICHRDLKPENFLFASKDPNAELKIIDFNLSNKFGSKLGRNKRMNTVLGTPYYIAPEVIKGDYNFKCDLWGCGIIMYMLLSGTLPFTGNSHKEIFQRIISEQADLTGYLWKGISEEALNLLKRLLQKDQSFRLSAEEALRHSWFKEANTEKKIAIDPQILDSLRRYKTTSLFQKEAMAIIVKDLKIEDIKELKEAFTHYDKSQTGFLSAQEIEEALVAAGCNLAADQVSEIIQNADYKRDGRINYSEFIAATLSSKIQLNEETLWNAFTHFDVDGTGYITEENVVAALKKTGKQLPLEEVQRMIQEVDQEKNGKLNFEEFKTMFLEGFNSLNMQL